MFYSPHADWLCILSSTLDGANYLWWGSSYTGDSPGETKTHPRGSGDLAPGLISYCPCPLTWWQVRWPGFPCVVSRCRHRVFAVPWVMFMSVLFIFGPQMSGLQRRLPWVPRLERPPLSLCISSLLICTVIPVTVSKDLVDVFVYYLCQLPEWGQELVCLVRCPGTG